LTNLWPIFHKFSTNFWNNFDTCSTNFDIFIDKKFYIFPVSLIIFWQILNKFLTNSEQILNKFLTYLLTKISKFPWFITFKKHNRQQNPTKINLNIFVKKGQNNFVSKIRKSSMMSMTKRANYFLTVIRAHLIQF